MPDIDPVSHSRDLLWAVRRGEETGRLESVLAGYDSVALADALPTDAERYAFWVNVYNAATQLALERNPDGYSKWLFFRRDIVAVADHWLSLDDIEHGILRRSRFKYGLGYVRVPDLFVSTFVRSHRVDELDPRIHFALNCGAHSCPPIAVYSATAIDEELDTATRSYLETDTTYRPSTGVVEVTPLFRFYRGDFGGQAGIWQFLVAHDQLPPAAEPDITYGEYDWSLRPKQFRESSTESGVDRHKSGAD